MKNTMQKITAMMSKSYLVTTIDGANSRVPIFILSTMNTS